MYVHLSVCAKASPLLGCLCCVPNPHTHTQCQHVTSTSIFSAKNNSPPSQSPRKKTKPSDALDGVKEERVEFRASGGLLRVLDDLKKNYGLSRSESIRRAITLFFIAKREQAKGFGLAVVDEHGNVVGEVHSF